MQGLRKKTQRQAAQGFSLLELLVVLVIIGLLAGLVGPRLFGKVDQSKQQTAETQIKMFKGVLETMYLDISRFPTTEEGLSILFTPPNDDSMGTLWRGPYLDEAAPNDPWNRPYQYEYTGSTTGTHARPFYLYSLGADGKRGGEGVNKDIGYLPQ